MKKIRDGFSEATSINPKKIIFIEGLLWNRHIAEIFEIADELKIETEIYYPSNDLRGNDNDVFHKRIPQNYDGEKLLRHIANIYGSPARIKESPSISRDILEKISDFWDEQKHLIDNNPASIKNIKYKDSETGTGILSSYYTYGRNIHFNPLELISKIRNDFINSAIIYERSLIIAGIHEEEIYCTFNGRLKYCRPIVDALSQMGKKIFYHERGATIDKYHFSSHSPHDFEAIQKTVAEINSEITPQNDEGKNFYIRRRGGDGIGWISFTEKQHFDNSPPWGNIKKPICAYFSSSDDEFLSIPGFVTSTLFPSQIEAIKALIRTAEQFGIQVVVKMHPNQMHVDAKTLKDWISLSEYGALVIPPDSSASSYQLLDDADFVSVYLSTMGSEALYNKKKVLLLGNSIISGIGSIKTVTAESEIEQFFSDPEDEKSREEKKQIAIALGYYYLNFGTEFKKYKPADHFTGTINGAPISAPEEARIVKALRTIKRNSLNILKKIPA